MECFNCKILYNENDHCPRLLITCGHSICEKCLQDQFYECRISCPECKTVNQVPNISAFPKNLALVNLKSGKIKTKSNTFNEIMHDTTRDISTICTKHGNRIDAFCEKDRLLMCITCIIEDKHKSHDLNSIQTAAQKEKALVHKAFELTKIIETKLSNMQREIVDAYQTLRESAEKSRIEVTNFFNNIRKILAERETLMKQKISNTLRNQENILKSQDEKIANHLKLIGTFYKECEKINTETDIKLLSGSLNRMDLIKKATSSIDPLDLNTPFAELNKEQELNVLWKIMNPPKNTINNNNNANYIKLANKVPISTPSLNIAKSNKLCNNNKESNIKGATHQNFCGSKIQVLQTKKETMTNINSDTQFQSQFPISMQLLNKNTNKIITHTISYKENINTFFKPEIRKVNNLALTNNALTDKKPSSPMRATSSSSHSANYHARKLQQQQQNYEQKLISENYSNNNDDMTEYENHCLNLSQERSEKSLNRSMSPTPSKKYLNKSHNNGMINNLNNSANLEIGSRTPLALHYLIKDNNNDHSRGDSINDDKTSKLDSRDDDISECGSLDYYKHHHEDDNDNDNNNNNNDSDNEPYIIKDCSINTNNELLDILASSEINHSNHKTHNNDNKKDISKLDLSAITYNHRNTVNSINNNNNSNINDISRRDLKTFIYESGTRYFLDNTDISQQKFDFSMICQQMSSSIYIIGGFIDNGSSIIERYDIQKSKWDIVGNLNKNRTKFAAVMLPNNNILILGGKQDRNRIATCEEFNIKDGTVKTSDFTLTTPKSGFGCLIIGNDIYTCGGNDGHSILKTFEYYSQTSKKWISLPSLRYKRDEPAIVIGLDQKIYVIGGFGGSNNSCLSSVERYDPQNGIWETIASLNAPRRALAAVTLPDGIYAIGGFDGENYLSTVERYDDSLNEWIFVSSMNYARCTFSAVSTGDCHNIYVFGGFDNAPLNTVERYSVINDSWEMISPMKYKRFMHASVIASNKSLGKS